MLRITLALLLALGAAAAPRPPGIERTVSPPSRTINDGYPVSGAVTGDGFSIMLLTGLRVQTTEVAPLATEPRKETMPLSIPRFAAIGGLPNGIVTAWLDDSGKLFASVSSKAGDVTVCRELPRHQTYIPILQGVTTNQTNALVLWYTYERDHAWASVLDGNGVPIAEVDVVPRGSIGRVSGLTTASDPGGFLVLYRDERQPSTLWATRVANDGEVTRFAMNIVATVSTALAAFDGTGYLIALQQGGAIHGILASVDGSSLSQPFLIDGDAGLAAITGRAGGSLLLCSNKAFVFDHVSRTHGPDYAAAGFAGFVLSDGARVLAAYANNGRFPPGAGSAQWFDLQTGRPLTDSFAISYGSPKQTQPAAALGTTVDLLVWTERDPATLEDAIRATRIARDGRTLDQPPLSLSIAGTGNERPAVAFNGGDFIVAWQEHIGRSGQGLGQRVRVQRISQGGQFLDATPRDIGTAVLSWSDLEAAHSGDTTLILWIGRAGNSFQTVGRRMTQDGELLDPVPFRVTQEATPQHWAFDLAAGAGGFLVTWAQSEGASTSVDVHAAQITTSGTVVAPRRLHAMDGHSIYRPRVAWDGKWYMVVWDQTATAFTSAFWAYPAFTMDIDDGILELGALDGKWAAVYGPFCCGGANAHEFLDPYNPWYRLDRETTPIEHENVADPRIASDGKRAILVYSRPLPDAPHAGSARVIFRLYGDPPPAVRRRAARH